MKSRRAPSQWLFLRPACSRYGGMHRLLLVIVAAVMAVGCSNPLPFGPGRVYVELDNVQVRQLEHEVVFGNDMPSPGERPARDVVQFTISSQADLYPYFKEWDRTIQVRCSVEGNTNGKTYSGFAKGPFNEGTDISRPEHPRWYASRPSPTTGRFVYTVNAFIDLTAMDIEYKGGKPATTLNLRTEKFDRLACHVLGVTKAPVLFPRTNDFVLGAAEFRKLYLQGQAHRQTNEPAPTGVSPTQESSRAGPP